ncbi:hypothetical protein MBLNU457_3502t2 [Dothideomycetes sp. NU457]
MAAIMDSSSSSRTPTHHRSSNSAPGGYFDFTPATQSDHVLIQKAMDSSVRRLDAFHDRPSPIFEYPENAHIYAARPLPPVPFTPTLKRPSSVKDLRTVTRPVLSPQSRTFTTDCIERPLPALPLRASNRASIESTSSIASKPCDQDATPRRPRQMRSISFRNFLNRNTYPQNIPEPLRSASSMSESSESSFGHDSRHDSIIADDSKYTTPASSAPGSRRPSTLSLSSLRSRKASQESVPALPRPSSGKATVSVTSAGRRWHFFGGGEKSVEDVENMPPVPITPPANSELNCRPCYYFSMRNCQGYVMGGSHGDACENCTMHGFFGSP